MFTIQELNLLCGLAWDEFYDEKLDITFHEKEDGFTEQVTISCKSGFTHLLKLSEPYRTFHLPRTMRFKNTDLRTLLRKLKYAYKNFNVVLPLEFREEGFEVMNGPCRGMKVKNQ